MSAPTVIVTTPDELRAIVREEIRAAHASAEPRSDAPSQRVTLEELSRVEACSRATIRRLIVDGAPVHHVGLSPRFDVAEWRAWCDARGPVGTKAAPSKASLGGVRRLTRRTA
jgi:hypothetical protein